MKQPIFIVIIIFKSFFGFAQNENFNDSLLRYEYSIFLNPDLEKEILPEKFDLLLKHKNFAEAGLELKRMESKNILPRDARGAWNGCLLSLQLNEIASAEDYFKLYWRTCDTGIQANQMLGFITYLNSDSAKANYFLKKMLVRDAAVNCLGCYYEYVNIQTKNVWPYLVTSIFIPGSGLIILGKPIKGIVSMAISTGFVLGSVAMINSGLFINLAGWTGGWGLKFYFGQLALTEKQHSEKFSASKNRAAKKCKKVFDAKLKATDLNYLFN